jgi:hypothetical protein
MPQPITEIATLQQYIQGVMQRAGHHAPDVDEVALTLIGAIVWRKDPDPIEVLRRQGQMVNVLWVRISGKRYAFSYNHDAGTIELRLESTQGGVLASFSNMSSAADIKTLFASL